MVRNFKQSKYFPLNPTRLWRNSAGPGDVATIATKHMINKGASKTIPETANMTSIILFEVNPMGRCDRTEANCKPLRVSTELFIWVLLKNKNQIIPQFILRAHF
jgi:hypothetical protein